jgi:hypothetical protein
LLVSVTIARLHQNSHWTPQTRNDRSVWHSAFVVENCKQFEKFRFIVYTIDFGVQHCSKVWNAVGVAVASMRNHTKGTNIACRSNMLSARQALFLFFASVASHIVASDARVCDKSTSRFLLMYCKMMQSSHHEIAPTDKHLMETKHTLDYQVGEYGTYGDERLEGYGGYGLHYGYGSYGGYGPYGGHGGYGAYGAYGGYGAYGKSHYGAPSICLY